MTTNLSNAPHLTPEQQKAVEEFESRIRFIIANTDSAAWIEKAREVIKETK